MVMIRRSKPAAGEAQEQKQAPARRVVLRRGSNTRKSEAEAEAAKRLVMADIDAQLQLIAKNDEAIDAAVASNDAAYAEIKRLLESAGMTGHTNGHYIAEIVTPMGRESREIDPKKFQKAVSPEDFWACIKVGVTDAKKVLSEKELDKISTVTPGKPGTPILKVDRVVIKTQKKKV